MEKLIALVQNAVEQEMKTNADKNKLGQIDSRNMKANGVSALMEVLNAVAEQVEGASTGMANSKAYITMDNEHVGMVTLEFDVKVKGLEFDLETEVELYEQEQAEKVEKERAKQAEKERKLAEKKAKAKK